MVRLSASYRRHERLSGRLLPRSWADYSVGNRVGDRGGTLFWRASVLEPQACDRVERGALLPGARRDSVPAFQQGDPRWSMELLGPTYDTIGQAGCAITSAAMVLSSYGVDIDPQRLNQYLNTHAGYTPTAMSIGKRRRKRPRMDRSKRRMRTYRAMHCWTVNWPRATR